MQNYSPPVLYVLREIKKNNQAANDHIENNISLEYIANKVRVCIKMNKAK